MSISCDICGADRSKSGKRFDGPSLAKHITIVHKSVGRSASSVPLACDICGATHNHRGTPFLTNANMLQHKSKTHPEAARPPQVTSRASAISDGSSVDPGGNHQEFTQRPKRRKPDAPVPNSNVRDSHAKFCPHCGFNLEVVNAAMAFVNGAPMK